MAYVGPGLRVQIDAGSERDGDQHAQHQPEGVPLPGRHGKPGEDLVEKQNAEQGLMPVMEDEAAAYGYVEENRHMVRAFWRASSSSRRSTTVAVTEMMMALYRSAETGRTVELPSAELEEYVPRLPGGTIEAEGSAVPQQVWLIVVTE